MLISSFIIALFISIISVIIVYILIPSFVF